ncbi:MAG: hypothetical protein ACTSQF_00045 [Candidatus Heimdallarchaeaceae archaeon]
MIKFITRYSIVLIICTALGFFIPVLIRDYYKSTDIAYAGAGFILGLLISWYMEDERLIKHK